MITVNVNGTEIEVQDEKQARKEIAKALRQERKEAKRRSEAYALAMVKARSEAYRVLQRKVTGEEFPRAWVFHPAGHKWFTSLAKPVAPEFGTRTNDHVLTKEDGDAPLSHFGFDLVGAVCGGAGFCLVVFLRDRDGDRKTYCHAVGMHDGQVALAECPNVTPEDFRQAQ